MAKRLKCWKKITTRDYVDVWKKEKGQRLVATQKQYEKEYEERLYGKSDLIPDKWMVLTGKESGVARIFKRNLVKSKALWHAKKYMEEHDTC